MSTVMTTQLCQDECVYCDDYTAVRMSASTVMTTQLCQDECVYCDDYTAVSG